MRSTVITLERGVAFFEDGTEVSNVSVDMLKASPQMLDALEEIAKRGPVKGYNSSGALLLRLVATQSIARAAIAKSKGKS